MREKNSKGFTVRDAVSVDVKNVSKTFAAQKVLDDISISVKPGEIFVIMGPSGAGKSVLLKHIIGLVQPDAGKVLINGKDASLRKTHSEIVTALVFQAGALFNSMNVYDNLALYPREHRLYDTETLDRKVMRALKMLSLENAVSKMPSELSGGMRKRVAIARGLMMEPQMLLYDEPTSELDPVSAASISEIIGTLKEEIGVTSIVVSHDRDLSRSVADRVAVIMDGKIRAVGSPKEVWASDDPRVQDFLNPEININNPRFRKQAVS